MDLIDTVGLLASIVLPLWNIPLIVKVLKRKSAEDISVPWVLGVWTCFVLMLPSGLRSDDVVWRAFNISNITLFTIVMIVVVKYRNRKVSDS